MRLAKTLALSATVVLWSVPAALALRWSCAVPEIDGPAGLSAMAILASVGMLAYERYKS